MKRECDTCIKNKTIFCPNSIECMTTDDIPYYQNNIMLLEENKQLKMINKEYERLNKEKHRGFKIINAQEYNIDELLSYKKYKDNWNKLKEWLNDFHKLSGFSQWEIVDKMQEMEGSDSNEY